jgi:hypothetical protein
MYKARNKRRKKNRSPYSGDQNEEKRVFFFSRSEILRLGTQQKGGSDFGGRMVFYVIISAITIIN